MAYYYQVFNLRFVSTFPLHGLRSVEPCRADVKFSFSRQPSDLGPNSSLLHLGSAQVSVRKDAVLAAGDDPELACVLSMTWILVVLLRLRGLLVLHAAAVGSENGAIVLFGPCGAGKSTLAAELCLEGLTFLTDDIALIRETELGFAVEALAGPVKLRQSAGEFLDLSRIGPSLCGPGGRTWWLPPVASGATRIGGLFSLNWSDRDEASVEALRTGPDQALELSRLFHTFPSASNVPPNPSLCSAVSLLKRCPLFRVHRPRHACRAWGDWFSCEAAKVLG